MRPQYPLAKENYSLSMYQSTFNQNKCFCQMCQRLYPLKYIERNDIERNPAYAWEQMYLNLCLTCSKDYILLRHNELLWQQFINNLMKVNVLSGGMFEIPIGNETIAFTATHLAEIQEIFKNEGWGDHAPKRKPVKGKSIDDEGKER